MTFSNHEFWTLLHGMIFGALFLLLFTGGWVGLYGLRSGWFSGQDHRHRLFWLKTTLWSMAAIAWGTVISGTFIVYPWYRAKPPAGVTDLSGFPQRLLLANPRTAEWHNFGMEWKEHVGWLVPIAMTVVAFAVSYYGTSLARKPAERCTLMIFYSVAFAAATIAVVVGVFIDKAAPIR